MSLLTFVSCLPRLINENNVRTFHVINFSSFYSLLLFPPLIPRISNISKFVCSKRVDIFARKSCRRCSREPTQPLFCQLFPEYQSDPSDVPVHLSRSTSVRRILSILLFAAVVLVVDHFRISRGQERDCRGYPELISESGPR